MCMCEKETYRDLYSAQQFAFTASHTSAGVSVWVCVRPTVREPCTDCVLRSQLSSRLPWPDFCEYDIRGLLWKNAMDVDVKKILICR